MAGMLSGIRIVDLSWIIAGPLAGRLLADFGAEVVKVESRRRMDVGRGNRTPLYGELPGDANSNPDAGGYFQDANAGKSSVTLNLQSDGGRELLLKLVVASDVVICNLAGDQLERWGIGYDVVRELNRGIIVVNIPTMESSGPRLAWRGFGDMFAGIAGLKSVSGHPGEAPVPWGHNYGDFASNPFHAAIAIMAALMHRDRTGEGQFIEVSQYESTVSLLGTTLLEHSLTGEAPQPKGNRDDVAAPHNFYHCEGDDSWCAIAVESDEQWAALVDFAGISALADDDFATVDGRRSNEEAIDALLDAWTVGWEPQPLAEALQQRGIPAGPYQTLGELVRDDPTLSDRYYHRLPHPSGRDFLVHGSPIQARRNPADVRLGPLIGEHTYEVLTEILGLSADEVAEYAAAGALE